MVQRVCRGWKGGIQRPASAPHTSTLFFTIKEKPYETFRQYYLPALLIDRSCRRGAGPDADRRPAWFRDRSGEGDHLRRGGDGEKQTDRRRKGRQFQIERRVLHQQPPARRI